MTLLDYLCRIIDSHNCLVGVSPDKAAYKTATEHPRIRAKRIAAEVRARRPEMQVKRIEVKL